MKIYQISSLAEHKLPQNSQQNKQTKTPKFEGQTFKESVWNVRWFVTADPAPLRSEDLRCLTETMRIPSVGISCMWLGQKESEDRDWRYWMNNRPKQGPVSTLVLLESKVQAYKTSARAPKRISPFSLVLHVLLNAPRKHQNNTYSYFIWQSSYYSTPCFEIPWNTKWE